MEILAGTINYTSLLCEIISFLVAFCLPIILAVVLKVKTKGSVKSLIFGVVGFILSAMIFEQILHYLILIMKSPVSDYVNSNTFVYCLYGCLAAGVFEETGRFVMYKTFLKKNRDSSVPLLYGIGHGGIEAVLLVGVQMLGVLILALQINSLGSASALKDLPPSAVSSTIALVQPLFTGRPFLLLAGGLERISAIALHMSLSILVYKAVVCNDKKWLYPLSILLHAVFDVPAVLYQKGFLSVLVCEAILFVFSFVLLFCVVKFVYRPIRKDDLK